MPEQHLKRITKVSNGFASNFKISASVGDWTVGAKNIPGDVETVQLLLQYASQNRRRKDLNPLGIDGKISRLPGKSNTVKAILAFQRGFMSRPDGIIDPEGMTINNLRKEVRGESSTSTAAAKSVMMAPHAGDGMPPWLHSFNGAKVFSPLSLLSTPNSPNPAWISTAEKELGEKEIEGKANNARIIEYHATTGKSKSEDTPWCASFVNWVLKQSGYQGTGSASSHSWKTWGNALSKPAVGSVAFIDWGKANAKKTGTGHVGFVVGKTAKGRIVLLGGNQRNSVRYTAFKESDIVTYRVPKGYEPGTNLYDLPTMQISQDGGGFGATR